MIAHTALSAIFASFKAPLRLFAGCVAPRTRARVQDDDTYGGTAPRWSAPATGLAPRVHTEAERAARGLEQAALALARGESPWPWLSALPETVCVDALPRWTQLVCSAPAPTPEDVTRPAALRLWGARALRAARHDPPLVLWLAERGAALPLDLRPLFFGGARKLLQPAARAALGVLFARLSLSDRQQVLARDRVIEMLPPSVHGLCAQAWLQQVPALLDDTGDVPLLCMLEDLLTDIGPVESDCQSYPELALVVDPSASLRRGGQALGDHAQAPWVQALLQRESLAAHRVQTEAQDNRLRALGQFLFACRAAAVPSAQRQAAGPLVLQLLALPEDSLRGPLLMRLAGALGDSTRAAVLLALPHGGLAAKALPLQLAVHLFQPDLAQEAGLQSLLRARPLFTHGAHARCLMRLMMRHEAPDYVRQSLGLTRLAHLFKYIDGAQQAHALEAARQAAQDGAHSMLDKHQAYAETLSAARLYLQPLRPSGAVKPNPATLRALQAAFTWLATQPALRPVARAALPLCNAGALSARTAPHKLLQLETLRTQQRAAAGKEQAWLQAWCATLVRTLQSFIAQPPAPPPAQPFTHPAVRALQQRHLLPLLLALEDYAPLLQAARRLPQEFAEADQVRAACLKWTGLAPRDLARLDDGGACPHMEYVALYQASMLDSWGASAVAGTALLKRLLRAILAGRLDAERRTGLQARHLLQTPGGAPLMQAWEAPTRTAVGQFTVEDSGAPGAMLAAVTQIHSCQSARDGTLNQGMLSRLADGAKRMVLLRDARGSLRARAMLRLMLSQNAQPVLLLSPLYAATGTCEVEAERAIHAHVRQRANALGVQAVCSSSSAVQLPSPGECLRLSSSSAPGDYWEEGDGLCTEMITLRRTLRQLAPAPKLGAPRLPAGR